MSRAYGSRAPVALLLLGTLALTGILAGSHSHDEIAVPVGHSDLPTFTAGHSSPDQTPHIEGATRTEASHCVACLQRQRQRAVEGLVPGVGGVVPRLAWAPLDDGGRSINGARRLVAARAPPQA